MYEVTKETLQKAYKPFDIVSDKDGNVGFIQEVNVNHCQPSFDSQISYAVQWLVGDQTIHAWWDHGELIKHCNLFIKMAEAACHPSGDNDQRVEMLFGHFGKGE